MSETDLQDLIHENMMRAFEKGQQAERERIIKLLEIEQLDISPENLRGGYDRLVFEGIKEQLIELIKGEQK